MARETKVGMLVGLGFIVCFAIILENRSRSVHPVSRSSGPPSTAALTQPEATRPGTSSATERVAQRYGNLTTRNPAGPSGRMQQHERRPADRSSPAPQKATGSPQRVDLQRGADGVDPVGASDPGRFTERTASAMVAPPQELGASSGQPTSAGPADGQASLTAKPPPTESRRTPSPDEPRPSSPQRTYRIQKGDSLSRIAKRTYGSSAPRIIDAIFQANRSILPSRDLMPLDKEIVLPDIPGSTPAKAAPPEQPAPNLPTTGGPSSDDATDGYRYYQVKPGDRYASIARRMLGDADRWHEIAELNKDVFPDPNRIRHGVRIRLPGAGAGTSSGNATGRRP
ncbi:MAG: LysM peptidoglycan-binding domain-containing protein [Planctomycetes bacterium]|nr:LysM peptidoglycan-binding domain-containing protein [Planctomycetota bacterium]